MSKLEKVVLTYIIKPVGDPIYSELATEITIDDESAGPFIKIHQSAENIANGTVLITKAEWPLIKEAVEELLEIWCKGEQNE